MSLTVTFRNFAAGGFLLLAALSGHALTVGAVRGEAVVGQSLDVSVPVALEAGEGASSLCFDGDVLYGSTRLDPNRVSMKPQAPSTPGAVMVRIRSTVAVDEPVVTVNLRVGCAGAVTRRYVLLADAPTNAMALSPAETAEPTGAATSSSARTDASPRPFSARTHQSVFRDHQTAASAHKRFVRSHPRHAAPRRVAKAAPVHHAVASAAAEVAREPAVSKAHLQLDPIDLPGINPSDLKISSELQATPVANDPKRAQAVAVWRTLNVSPQDALNDAQRMQTLETEMNSLRAQSLKNQASLLEVTTQLQRAADRKFSNTLVYALLALLAAAVGSAMYLALQMRRAARPVQRSWSGRDGGLADHEDRALGPMGATIISPLADQFPQAASRFNPGGDVSPLVATEPESSGAISGKSPRAAAPLQPADISAARAVNAEELFDIQQQADFFVSLGQHEQAIELLKQHIDENAGTSPLAYLDLLGIYHRFDLKDDYVRLRGDFTRAFNVQVPPFEAFSGASKGLEAYPAALARIEALWPSAKVLDAIEASIFRRPGVGDGEESAFDPEAYRELLLLFSIAREVTGTSGTDRRVDTSQAGWGAPDTMPPMTPPPPSPRLGLDVDLSDPSAL